MTAAETIALAGAARLRPLVEVATGSVQPGNIAAGVTWTRLAFGTAA